MKFSAQLLLVLAGMLLSPVLSAHPGHPFNEMTLLHLIAEAAWSMLWLMPVAIWFLWRLDKHAKGGNSI